MPIRKPKPTSPGRRFATYADFAEITKTKPEKSLVEGLRKSGGRNANGRKTSRHRGGGAKRAVPQDRLQAPQGRRPRPRRRDRVRPQPLGVHRAAALRRRREGLHPRPGPPARRHDRSVRRRRRHRRRQLPAAERHARRAPSSTTSSCSPAAAARWAAPPGRRHPAHGEGRRHGDAAPAVRRDAHGARGLPRDRRRRSATPTTRTSRSARPAASVTWACARRPAARP